MGDTFAHGRLTNPPHQHWEHFETFHVFHRPTYQGKYPPGQGIALAIGQVLFDLPLAGVWISLAFACGAVCWMLLAFFPARWAFLGALAVGLNNAILFRWGQGYWGGAVALLGGALFIGGLFRLRKELRLGNTLIMGLGMVILSISRPFEGLIVVLCSVVLILYAMVHWIRAGRTMKLLTVFLFPIVAISVIGAGWQMYYNYRLTDDPLTLPYKNYRVQGKARSTNPEIKKYKGSPKIKKQVKIHRIWVFFFGPALSLALLGLWRDWKRPETIFAIVVSLLAVAVSVRKTSAWPHYLAPVVPLFIYLVMRGFWALHTIEIKKIRFGYYLSIGILTWFFLSSSHKLYRILDKGPYFSTSRIRWEIIRFLTKAEGRDLVFVRYKKRHNVHEEWVYNRADIDGSEIVWARELSPQRNRLLRKYFHDRRMWLVLADRHPVQLVAYPEAESENER
jgi:hypothetical protein